MIAKGFIDTSVKIITNLVVHPPPQPPTHSASLAFTSIVPSHSLMWPLPLRHRFPPLSTWSPCQRLMPHAHVKGKKFLLLLPPILLLLLPLRKEKGALLSSNYHL